MGLWGLYTSLWGYQCGEHDQDRQNIIGGMHGCSCPNKMIMIGHEPSQCTVDMDETCFLMGMIYIYINKVNACSMFFLDYLPEDTGLIAFLS